MGVGAIMMKNNDEADKGLVEDRAVDLNESQPLSVIGNTAHYRLDVPISAQSRYFLYQQHCSGGLRSTSYNN